MTGAVLKALNSLFRPKGCHVYYFRVPRALDPRKRIPTQETSKEKAEECLRRWFRLDEAGRAAWRQERRQESTGTVTEQDKLAEYDEMPIADHLRAWIDALREYEELDEAWLRQKRYQVDRLCAGCHWERVSKANAYDADRWLKKQLKDKKLRRNSVNQYITHARQFGAWLLSEGRVQVDKFAAKNPAGRPILRRRKARDCHVSFQRRALTADELRRLIAAASKYRLHKMSGPDRAMAYHLASLTGLRRGELAKLTLEDFFLDDEPVVVLQGQCTKNGDNARQPLRSDLVEALRPWLATKRRGLLLFPGLAEKRTVRMIRKDLERADIAYDIPGAGRVDFHALRVTYTRFLFLARVAPDEAQKLLRHGSIDLTTNAYNKIGRPELAEAVERTRRTGEQKSEQKPVTSQQSAWLVR